MPTSTSLTYPNPTNAPKLVFAGHETFQCRSLWLTKGFDFIRDGHSFASPEAVARLGVGKNMVRSIRYWMNAFGIIENSEITRLGRFLLSPRGKDRYLQKLGTLWLLHYRLVSKGSVSSASLLFNEFRREKTDFTKEQFKSFLIKHCKQLETPISPTTIEKDVNTLLKNYLRPSSKTQNLEDDYSGIFLELELIRESAKHEGETSKRYIIRSESRESIPPEIILFCILDNEKLGSSTGFHELLHGFNSVGSIFALNADSLLKKIESLIHKYSWITYREDAGIRELQFKKRKDKWDILTDYYAN